MPLRYSFQASKTAPQQAPQPQLASKPAPKQPVPVPDQPQQQGGPCGSTPPSTAPKAKQLSRADADKEARDELMQRRDRSYQKGYKPRWIIYCATAIAPMIVEGAEVKPAETRAPQDHVAVIIPNDQWSPSQQGDEEEEDDWSEFMPSCQVFSAKSKAYEELDKWQSWWETYEADDIVDLCRDPKTMRMSPSKPPTPKKKKPQGEPPAQPPAPPQEDKGPAEAAAPAEAPAAAAQEEEAPAPAAAAAQEDDAPAPPQEEEAPAAAPQEGEGAAPKEEEAPEGETPEGDPSPQEEGDAAPAATGAEDHRPEWEKEWEAEVVVKTIKEITE